MFGWWAACLATLIGRSEHARSLWPFGRRRLRWMQSRDRDRPMLIELARYDGEVISGRGEQWSGRHVRPTLDLAIMLKCYLQFRKRYEHGRYLSGAAAAAATVAAAASLGNQPRRDLGEGISARCWQT